MDVRRCVLQMAIVVVSSFIILYYLASYDTTSSSSWSLTAPKPCGVACSVEESPHFVLHTPACIIPDFDPNHPSIVQFMKTENRKVVCSARRPLTETKGLVLRAFPDRAGDYHVTWASINCSYQGIRRIQQDPNRYNTNCDKDSRVKESIIAITSRETAIQEDGILVRCTHNSTLIYKNVHYFLQPNRVQDKRDQFQKAHGTRQPRKDKLSVIIMGTDAVSRGNLRRHMPMTFQYLKHSLEAIDLQGFNKVADNTDPNMMAALMGMTVDELMKHPCQPKKNAKFDDCPLIWKEFSKQGYATAYGEDAPWMGLFHYGKVGYVKEPTDYYNRPYFLISEKEISHNADIGSSNGKICQGYNLSMSVIHDYSLSVAEALQDIPYFGYYWSASLTHDYLTMAKSADEPSLRYLQEIYSKGYLEHTILFFISDHGQRWGDFRSTYAGMLEERLPYVMIVFPPWFKDQYPEAWANLLTNTRRLTSTFDIYVTLLDILSQAYQHLSSEPTASVHGQSLFREVPLERTCKDASVSEHFCACQLTTEVDATDRRLKTVGQFVVRQLNKGLNAFPQCVPLKLERVLRGRMGTASNGTIPQNTESVAITYSVAIVTSPGEAELEATVKYHMRKHELVSDVSRINKYGNQSHCTTDPVYRKYCYCTDMLPKDT